MKEVENNEDLNSVLEKIKADCKRDVKLAADQYEYNKVSSMQGPSVLHSGAFAAPGAFVAHAAPNALAVPVALVAPAAPAEPAEPASLSLR